MPSSLLVRLPNSFRTLICNLVVFLGEASLTQSTLPYSITDQLPDEVVNIIVSCSWTYLPLFGWRWPTLCWSVSLRIKRLFKDKKNVFSLTSIVPIRSSGKDLQEKTLVFVVNPFKRDIARAVWGPEYSQPCPSASPWGERADQHLCRINSHGIRAS